MLADLLFFGLISSGSFFCAIKFNKKYEEVLPITCMGIGFLLFLSGLLGCLKEGAFLALGIAVMLYFFAIVEFIKNRNEIVNIFKKFARDYFSAGFLVFVFIYVILNFSMRGLLAREWDDFSHWTDIVKVMTTMNDFGTNPESHSLFNSYPPAMALFQYMLQKLNRFLGSGETFSEWRCFFAYQIYMISSVMPMMKKSKYKNIVHNITFMAIILLVPLIFFDFVYNSSKIDPFLAMLTSAGLLEIISRKKEEKDIFYSIYIWILIATLVLSKDSGMIFAIFISIAYVADCCLDPLKLSKKRTLVFSLITFLALYIPKMLWKLHLNHTKAEIHFSEKIDWAVLLNVILGKDTSYKRDVMTSFFSALLEKRICLGFLGVEVNYLTVILVEILLVFILLVIFYKKGYFLEKQGFAYGINFLILMVGYTLGMCVLYMFKFSEEEVLKLASLERYLGTVFMVGAMLVLCLIWKILLDGAEKERKLFGSILLVLTLIICPVDKFLHVMDGTNIAEAVYVREGTSYLIEKILHTCDGNDKICLVNQNGIGHESLMLKYGVRPNVMDMSLTEKISEIAYYTGNVNQMVEDVKEEIILNYDYVAIYRYDEYFKDQFASLFTDRDDVSRHGLYLIDKKCGILIPVAENVY